ncbi:MAG TPA: RnfH family protein, partial [Steroidobacteraceae bacterium]
LQMPQGALVADALARAATDQDFCGLELNDTPVGIYGKLVPRDQALKAGDRIEIYRPLLEEPKLARRKRASKSGRS